MQLEAALHADARLDGAGFMEICGRRCDALTGLEAAGVPDNYREIRTLRDLFASEYRFMDAREQMKQNLMSRLQVRGQESNARTISDAVLPGIIGYDDDVLPMVFRAVLAGHDILFVGQMGQAKTRIARDMAESLLSPMPVIERSLTNDSPFDLPKARLAELLDDRDGESGPHFFISPESEKRIRDSGLDTRIAWADGISRYRYVLATPDMSVKDLVGYIDAIKIAKQGVEMHRIESYSPGHLMQAKHGILCIDELPVLDPRKQVALLSVLQEGKFTTGPYPVTFEPRTIFLATANPIDYTHSGRVIEPLYDRLKSHIHTHYPGTAQDEMLIIAQEAHACGALAPVPVLRVLASLAQKMRKSDAINQERGVSARLGIHGLEILAGEAQRCRPDHAPPIPRLTDMHCLGQVAKFELSAIDDDQKSRSRVFGTMLEDAIREMTLEAASGLEQDQRDLIRKELAETGFSVSQKMTWISYQERLEKHPSLAEALRSRRGWLESMQQDWANRAGRRGIAGAGLTFELRQELNALLLEMILEGLCHTSPKILDKKDLEYGAA